MTLYSDHQYDNSNRIISQNWQIGSDTFSESYEYRTTDGTLSAMTADGDEIAFEYDVLKRADKRTQYTGCGEEKTALLSMVYDYHTNTSGDETARIRSIKYLDPEVLSMSVLPEYGYQYSTQVFIDRVMPGGVWDFKSQKEWDLKPDYTYYYNGKALRYDDIGNIHYGYVGRVLFPEEMLLIAVGVVQVYTKTTKVRYLFSNLDDPRDQEMIRYGSILWELDKEDL